MRFHQSGAELFVPDGLPPEEALARTTHVAIGAHPDDIEILAYHGIAECFGREDRWFAGVTVTDGAGSPRVGPYERYADEEMRKIRKAEQIKAAIIGEYAAIALLDYPTSAVKDPARTEVVGDLETILRAARPDVLYTHNPADKHETHVAAALRAIAAARRLPAGERPRAFYGCEVWRDLDWLLDADKRALDVGARENLAAALVGVFDSQISGGKRYDLATAGRRRAHATYHESHGADVSAALTFAMDLTPLLEDPGLDVAEYVLGHIRRFEEDVATKLRKLSCV